MNKIYHLSSCSTCKNILRQLNPPDSFLLQDIRQQPLTEEQLEEMKNLAGSYESLFSKRARLYREKGLQNEELTEARLKNLILQHDTFLKRPVIIHNDQIFIGNSAKTMEAAKKAIHG